MIGKWQQFGSGQPPEDGEGLVYIEQYGDIIDLLEGRGRRVVFAVYRNGILHEQSGSSYSPTYGTWWTSLPYPHEQD